MGTKQQKITKETKTEILRRIKDEGISVTVLAEEYGIHSSSIYNWLSRGIGGQPTLAEFARLKKQNKELLELIGKLTLELSTTQKKN